MNQTHKVQLGHSETGQSEIYQAYFFQDCLKSSDEEDIGGKITPLVVTSEDEIDYKDLTTCEELAKEPKEGDYVLVKFNTGKLTAVFCVRKIIKEKYVESDLEVSYLRRYKKHLISFVCLQKSLTQHQFL